MVANCTVPACERAPMTSSGGWVYTRCWDCISAALTSAFAPVSWHERAKAHELPTAIVGGVPLTTPHDAQQGSGGRVETGPKTVSSSGALLVAAVATTAGHAG